MVKPGIGVKEAKPLYGFRAGGWESESKGFHPTSYVTDLVGKEPNSVACFSVGLVLLVTVFFLILISLAGKRWEAEKAERAAGSEPNSIEP